MQTSHTRQARTLGAALAFVIGFSFHLLFGWLGDLPSRVFKPENEPPFSNAKQWSSAVFHAGLALFLLTTYGPIGLLSLALSTLIWARRMSAAKGVPYTVAALLGHIGAVLAGSPRLKLAALISTAIALVFSLLFLLFQWPTNFLAFVAWTVSWGTWLLIASKAAKVNISLETERAAEREASEALLAKVYSTPASEWKSSNIEKNGLEITVTSPPPGAVLHYKDADALLAILAPELEHSADSDVRSLRLIPASEATLQRREIEKHTGGLISGQVEVSTGASRVLTPAAVSFTAEDLI